MPIASAEAYHRHAQRVARRSTEGSAAAREISHRMPAVKYPSRRRACCQSLRQFCERYFPAVFVWEWSADHLQVIAALESAIIHGNRMALAMPRGSGKTALLAVAAIWAVFTGRRKYVVLIAADNEKSEKLLATITTHLTSEILAEDFPEVSYPIKALAGVKQARKLFHGQPIEMQIAKDRIRFPNVPGSPAFGAVIESHSITGSVRGLQQATQTGQLNRPDLLLIDDPQTDDSAKSPTQTADRLTIIRGALLGLAGPGKALAALAAVTVIRPDDVAAQLLDHAKNPGWRGLKFGLIDFANFDDWVRREIVQEYWQIRANELVKNEDGAWPVATAFYVDNQAEIDAGATARWPERYTRGREVSAIQHALDLLQDVQRDVFSAEYQNDPEDQRVLDETTLRPEDLIHRLSHVPRRIVPDQSTRLTAFIDVHASLLYYRVLATDDKFTCWTVDRGTWPEQRLSRFTLRDVANTIQRKHDDQPTLELQLTAALHTLFDALLGRDWPTQAGDKRQIDRLLVDAQWGPQTGTVYDAIRTSAHRARILPSHGKFIGASSESLISQWKQKPGETAGEEWRIGVNRRLRRITFDANYWKTQAATRLRAASGAVGSAMFWGDDPLAHELDAEHLTSEQATQVESKIRRVHEWKPLPNRDNHWWDCFVGCLVAASTLGAKAVAGTTAAGPKKRTMSIEEMKAEARAAGQRGAR